MSGTEIVSMLIAALSLITLVIREVAKLRWAKEFSAAKQAQIELLQTQIQTLQDITPMRMVEYLKSTKEGLGEQIEELEQKLKAAREEAKLKQELADKMPSLEREIKELQNRLEALTRVTELPVDTLIKAFSGSGTFGVRSEVTITEPVSIYTPVDDEGHPINR